MDSCMRGAWRGLGVGAVFAGVMALAPAPAAAQVISWQATFANTTTPSPVSPLTVAAARTASQDNRVIVAIAARATAGVPNITNVELITGGGNVALTRDAGPYTTTGTTDGHVWVYSGPITSTTTGITSIRVTFTGAVLKMHIHANEYAGLTRTAPPEEVAEGTNTASGIASPIASNFSAAGITTTRGDVLLFGVAAATASVAGSSTVIAPQALFLTRGSINSPLVNALSSLAASEVITTAGTNNRTVSYTFGGATQRRAVSALLAYRAAPQRIATSGGPSSLTAGVCSTGFAYQIRAPLPLTGAVPPLAATVLTVTSSSPTADVAIGGCPAGGEGNVANVNLTSTDTSFTIFVTDPVAGAGKTLTAAFSSGNAGESLTPATFNYDVAGGAVAGYCLELPGQTFVPGQCVIGAPGFCDLLDPPTDQTAGVPFNARIIAMDSTCNPTQPSPSSVSINWSGFNGPAGDGSTPVLPSPIDFVAGEVTVSLTAVVVEPAFPLFDDGTLLGGGFDSFGSPWFVNILGPPNTTTVDLSHPNAVTPTRAAVSAHANGEIEARITNGTAGGITVVTITDPDGAGTDWVWDPAGSTVFDGTGTSLIGSGWTITLGGGGALSFTAATSSTFPNGTTLRFRARNTGGVYPTVTVNPQEYGVDINYTGFQNGSASFSGGGGAGFVVRPELPVAVLPTVGRSVALGTPRINWTLADLNVNVTSAGALVVRGTDPPLDMRQYAAGDPITVNTVVACRVTAPTTNCQDASGAVDGTAYTYVVYQFDASNGYSAPVTLTVPARPATGYVHRHTGTGLGSGALPDAESGGSAAPGATNPFVVFTSNSNNGVYMVRADGSEQRRPVTTVADVARRASAVRLTNGTYQVYAADTGTNAYRIDPTNSSGAQVVSLGAPVTGGPNGITSASFASLNIAYNGNGIFFATNGGANNYVRAYRSDLTTPWAPPDFIFPDATDGVSADSYAFTNNASATGIMMIPVGFGGGGIYGINLTTAQPVQPAGWAGQKIFAGTQFRAQCRRPGTAAHVFCGDTGGTVYAITASTGVQLGGTFNVGTSVLNLTPVQGGDVIVVTRAPATVSRLSFNGTTFANVWGPVSITGATSLSSPLVLNSANKILVTGDTSAGAGGAAVSRITLSTGAVGPSTPLDGDDVSDPTYDNVNDLVIMQTDTGTIWAKTGASL